MKVEKTRDNCLARLEALRIANKRQEFDGKDYHSVKSIVLQISQCTLLSPRNKLILMLDVVARIEEYHL